MAALPTCDQLDGSSSNSLVGKVVSSEQAAYDMYNEYAAQVGFSIRRGVQRYISKTTVIREKEFNCSCSGHKIIKKQAEVVRYSKTEYRCGCLAMIRFTVSGEEWKVVLHVRPHNHYLAKDEEVQYLRSHRKITSDKASVIDIFKQAGIRTSEVYNYVSQDANGSENVGYTRRDCYNYVNKQRMTMIEAGDAQSLVDSFKEKMKDDPSFFYTEQVDQEGRLTNFFWRDGRSRLDYEAFGDVVVFDTTYRTNRYNLVCAPFIGVNNHWKNIMFGCAFMLDEKTESFVWLFKSFLAAMGDCPPTTIITDQDQAMGKAIEIVFPNTVHRLCLWHISKNYSEHLGKLNSIPQFMKKFRKCVYKTQTEEDFEKAWRDMIVEHQCEEHVWLKNFYNIRKKWCRSINKGYFCGDIKSSQRSESTNNVLNDIASATTGLTEFLNGYVNLVNRWRENEKQDQFATRKGKPTLIVKNSCILNHASKVYTLTMYSRFEKEYLQLLGTTCKETSCDDDGLLMYEVVAQNPNEPVDEDEGWSESNEGEMNVHTVSFDPAGENVQCSCKRYESLGLLCCHALKVLFVNNVTKIPDQYILPRWTKEARVVPIGLNSGACHAGGNLNDEETELSFRNRLQRRSYNIVLKCKHTAKAKQIYDRGLRKLEEEIDAEIMASTVAEPVNLNENQQVEGSNEEQRRRNPPRRRPKGVSNARLKGHFEKKTKAKGRKIKTKNGASETLASDQMATDACTLSGDVRQNVYFPTLHNVYPPMMPVHIPNQQHMSSLLAETSFVSILQGMHPPGYYSQ